jgi:hypothetical protein
MTAPALPRDCYGYVRRHYNVPAYIGVRVSARGSAGTVEGTVVAYRCEDQYVHVQFDGKAFAVPCHPLDLTYLGVLALARTA